MPLALVSLAAAATLREVVRRDLTLRGQLMERRPDLFTSSLAVDQGGETGGKFIESDPAFYDCPAFSACSWNEAIERSYARCAKLGGSVGAVCDVTTGGMAGLGGVVGSAIKIVKGWF